MATAAIDPRLQARRIEVHRALGRKRLSFLLYGLVALALIAATIYVLRSPLTDLNEIRYSSLPGERQAEVEAATNLQLGTQLLDINTRSIEDRLLTIPWVESATVTRDWPSVLRVEVVERVAVAQLAQPNGTLAILDADGVVMAEYEPAYASLPLVHYQQEVALGQVVGDTLPALNLIAELPEDLHTWVESTSLIPAGTDGTRFHLSLNLVGGATAKLGNPTLREAKIESLRTVLGRVDLEHICSIDVTVPELPIIRRHPSCS